MNEKLLTIQEAAKKLKVSTKTLRRWEANGTLLPGRTSGAHRRYTEEQINSFIQNAKAAKSHKTSPQLSTPFADILTTPFSPPPTNQNSTAAGVPITKEMPVSQPVPKTPEPTPFTFSFTPPAEVKPEIPESTSTPPIQSTSTTQAVTQISSPQTQPTTTLPAEQPIPTPIKTPIAADRAPQNPPPPSVPSFHFGRREAVTLGSAAVSLILILIVFTMGYRSLSSNSHTLSAKIDSEKISMEKSVLAAASRPASTGKGLKGIFNVNIPTYFKDFVNIKQNVTVSGEANFDGDVYISGKKFVVNSDISAPNVVYSISAGDCLS